MASPVPERGQGSIWRRWDPHVHFPGTVLNDQFKGLSIADALARLAGRTPAIEAVGVTDYCTTRGFRRVLATWRAGAGTNISYLFPNVELRLDVATTRGRAVNIHLLCPAEQVDGLDAFIGGLDFTYGDRVFRADEQGLIALGRFFTNNPSLDDNAAFRTGALQFKVNFRQLQQKLSDRWAVENCLVAVAGSRGDGTSGMQTADGAYVALRQSIERASDIIFSPSPQQVAFWLGRGADDEHEIERLYGSLKPCMHGSDAHAEETLGVPDMDRLTWLKGDPTFDTLRMACLAPASRVSIGSQPPTAGFEHDRMSAVSVRNADWFANGRVALNPGLVAIIGPRGSGKTALADVIAAGAGSPEPFDNSFSFVRRATDLLTGSVAVVEWTHGDATTRVLDDPSTVDQPSRRLRYLSQQFVERLCASDGITDELLREIERVVFSAWPVGDRQGAVDFRELLDIRLAGARLRQRANLDRITQIGEQLADEQAQIRSIPALMASRDELARKISTLKSQTQDLTSQASLGSVERLSAVRSAVAIREEALQRVDRRRTQLRALQSATTLAISTTFRQYHASLREKHSAAGLSDAQWAAFTVSFSGDVSGILESSIQLADDEHAQLAGHAGLVPAQGGLDQLGADQLLQRNVAELKAERDRLQALVGLDERRTQQLRRLDEQMASATAQLKAIETSIETANGFKARRGLLVEERQGAYADYFDALLEEATELASLYEPLTSKLIGYGRSAAKVRLSVRRTVDVSTWARQGEALLDLRTEGAFRLIGTLEQIARTELLAAWESGNGTEASAAVQAFSSRYSEDLRRQGAARDRDGETYAAWEKAISRWLYSADHVTLSYSLEYDGVDIRRLSPGTRGIVLLLLYLAVDGDEVDPLIIDQPEENLDPQSVYKELVQLFQQASARRQILMVTHNANLVVNTDVDQVIVASVEGIEAGRLPRLNYFSGGLEDPEVRRAVCQVLEGGEEAFRQRARRLRIELPMPGTPEHPEA